MREVSFSTFIDHFDILSVEWDKATKAILDCGFVMDNGSNELPPFNPTAATGQKRSFKDIIKTQFMFRNCYMISTHATSKEDGLYHCYGNYDPAHPGMYHLVFGSHDIERLYGRIKNTDLKVRYEEDFCGEIGWTGRFCVNGVKKGQMVVAGLTLEREYADMSILLNNQKTGHLLYHPGQYRHINGATEIAEMVLCVDDPAEFDAFSRDIPIITDCIEYSVLDSGIKTLTLMDSEAVESKYGVSLKKNRTGQMGLVFIVPDFESLDFVLDINHVPHAVKDDCRIVDVSKETGAFFVFKTK